MINCDWTIRLTPLLIFITIHKFAYAETISLKYPFDVLIKKDISCEMRRWHAHAEHDPDSTCSIGNSILFKNYSAYIIIGLRNKKVKSLTIAFEEKYRNSSNFKHEIFQTFGFDLSKNEITYEKKISGVFYSYEPQSMTLNIVDLNLSP